MLWMCTHQPSNSKEMQTTPENSKKNRAAARGFEYLLMCNEIRRAGRVRPHRRGLQAKNRNFLVKNFTSWRPNLFEIVRRPLLVGWAKELQKNYSFKFFAVFGFGRFCFLWRRCAVLASRVFACRLSRTVLGERSKVFHVGGRANDNPNWISSRFCGFWRLGRLTRCLAHGRLKIVFFIRDMVVVRGSAKIMRFQYSPRRPTSWRCGALRRLSDNAAKIWAIWGVSSWPVTFFPWRRRLSGES